MKIECTEELDRRKRLGIPESFCSVPFTTLQLEPDGKVTCCRQKGSDFFVGDLKKNSLLEIWNGRQMQEWRQEFLVESVQTCRSEIHHRKCQLCPEYNLMKSDFQLDPYQSQMPERISFNLNGKCNLECIMCDIWRQPNGFYDRFGLWDQLVALTANLKEIELLSGEPFIQKDTYRLIDQISALRPDCLWTITTNANWKMNDLIREKLDLIKLKYIIVSLDCTRPESYAVIRKNGNFQLAIRTIKDLRDYSQEREQRGMLGFKVRINFLYQKENWMELPESFELTEKLGVDGFRTFLYEPSHLSLLSLSERDRTNIIEHFMKMDAYKIQRSMRVILPLLESLRPADRFHFVMEIRRRIDQGSHHTFFSGMQDESSR